MVVFLIIDILILNQKFPFQADAFRGHDFSLLDDQARLRGLQFMLIPQESPLSTSIYYLELLNGVQKIHYYTLSNKHTDLLILSNGKVSVGMPTDTKLVLILARMNCVGNVNFRIECVNPRM